MKWCRTFSPGLPLRNIRVVKPGSASPAETSNTRDSAREQAAFERGIAEGERRLGEQLMRQRSELLELQNGVLASLRQTVPQVVQQNESALIQLGLDVAQKLVNGLPISSEMIEAAVRAAVAQAEDNAELQVFLHADDLTLLQKCNSPTLLPGPGNEMLRFQTSPDVTRGGCMVQSRFGIVDARRETKMELVRQSIDA